MQSPAYAVNRLRAAAWAVVTHMFNAPTAFQGDGKDHTNRHKARASVLKTCLAVCVLGIVGSNYQMIAAIAPSSLNWVSVPVGGKSAQKVVTLTNSATTNITISNISLSGANPGDFIIFSKTCGTSLAPSASCTVNVIFAPTAVGSRTAILTVTDTNTGTPPSVALSGNGVAATASVAPASVSFADTAAGATSPPQTATLTNGTSAAITISNVAITGAKAAAFAISSKTCGATLAASASCTASFVFKPTAIGTFTAGLTFTDSDANSPHIVPLSGSSPATFTFRPWGPAVVVNHLLQFSATSDVTWSASCGTIASTSGLYTAPSATGSCRVTAAQVASPHLTISTIVSVIAIPTSGKLGVYPTSAAVVAGTVQRFQAQLSGVPDDDSLTYSIDGVVGGNPVTGTISSDGLYTAPVADGAHNLTVRDNSLGTTAASTIIVFSSVSVDFASRSTSLHAIPPNFFGAERMNSLKTADLNLVEAAGFNYARFYAETPIVFKTTTPNWAPIDAAVREMAAGGVKVMLQMNQTPPWLQPANNACGAGNPNAPPTDVKAWASIAVQYVKHMDTAFPGVVTDYEIWNEPDTAAFCVPAASRMSGYLALYAAAAPLMRAQIKADGSTARVGGPATAGLQGGWVSAMLADPVMSQNIDFVSYHHYKFGDTTMGAEWDTYNGTSSVYQKTQDDSGDPLSVYLIASRLVALGKQPQGKNLPIYNSEYNLNWHYADNCCQNDFTYSPVWNGMHIADVLNSVYAGAPNTPAHMVYFAATAPHFCLVGEIDRNMDCAFPAGSVAQPYPQYFLYQLLGSSKYLGLQNGGYMANSISPGIMGNGLVVTAYFTANLDAIVLINPNPSTYSNITVNIANTGLTVPAATIYRIVNGQSIQANSLSLKSQGGTSYSTALTLGPYSVQAISIHH